MRVAHMKSPIKFGYCSMPRVRTFGHPAPGQIIAYISCAFIPLSRIIAPQTLPPAPNYRKDKRTLQ